ncbi:MAG: DNA repair protein RadA [bacterium]
MPKSKTIFLCSKCDNQFPVWQGRCPECSAWGTLEPQISQTKNNLEKVKAPNVTSFTEIQGKGVARLVTGINELDHVLGGGIVPGSLSLLGGAPGIGKSTLVVQIASGLAEQKKKTLYVSGEESGEQIKLRLDRLKLSGEMMDFLGETEVESIIAAAESNKPDFLIVDSIQTMTSSLLPSEAGTIAQVRTVTNQLLQFAKKQTCAVLIIGHVTKEGSVAGPKTLEHLVDTVLYLEGDNKHQYRLLRSAKNRFGSTNEIGIFSMNKTGLVEVPNPSEMFLSERQPGSGTVVTATVEGSRAWLVELQALVNPTVFGMPRRTAMGVDAQRLQLIMAVLSRRVGLKLGAQDVYLNVVGGLSVKEPAADLAVATAIASALKDKSVDPKTAMISEVGLGGELRSVSNIDKRIVELTKLGFNRVVLSHNSQVKAGKINLVKVKTVREALKIIINY